MKTFNSSEILDRLRTALNIPNDTELAAYLGIKKATLSNWRARNSIDWSLVFSFCEHTDTNWLIFGKPISDADTPPPGSNTADSSDVISHLEAIIEKKDQRIEQLCKENGRMEAQLKQLEGEAAKLDTPRYATQSTLETAPT